MSGQMDTQLFQLKFTAKQVAKLSVKCAKNERVQKDKLKAAIEKGNLDSARIYAENAIREKNQSVQYLRLAGRIESVAAKVEAAVKMKSVSRSMAGVVKGMDAALASMDVGRITAIMDRFEAQFESLDMQAEVLDAAMTTQQHLAAPSEQVDALIGVVADEHGLELKEKMGGLAAPPLGAAADADAAPAAVAAPAPAEKQKEALPAGAAADAVPPNAQAEDELTQRLARLKQGL